MEKAFKFRIYPNKSQRELIEINLNSARWVYNKALETRIAIYRNENRTISAFDLMKLIPSWKCDNEYLRKADSLALIEAIRNLDRAYRNFFRDRKNTGFPKFKSAKTSRKSYKTSGKTLRVIDDRHIRLPKLGVVRAAISRPVEGRILSAAVSKDPTEKYYVSFCCTDVPDLEPDCPRGGKIGIGMRLGEPLTLANGNGAPESFCVIPLFLLDKLGRIKELQRELRELKDNPVLYRKKKLGLSRLYEKARNQRADYISKLTTDIVRNHDTIIAENPAVRKSKDDSDLMRIAADSALCEIVRQLEYKSKWHKRTFLRVDPIDMPKTNDLSEMLRRASAVLSAGMEILNGH